MKEENDRKRDSIYMKKVSRSAAASAASESVATSLASSLASSTSSATSLASPAHHRNRRRPPHFRRRFVLNDAVDDDFPAPAP